MALEKAIMRHVQQSMFSSIEPQIPDSSSPTPLSQSNQSLKTTDLATVTPADVLHRGLKLQSVCSSETKSEPSSQRGRKVSTGAKTRYVKGGITCHMNSLLPVSRSVFWSILL